MNYTIKLLIPAGLGIAAAAINWFVLYSGTQPVYFVTVTEALEVGDRFDLAQAAELAVPPTFRGLADTIVPFEDRGVLSGRVVQRRIEPGDPVFYHDTDLRGPRLDLRPGEELFPVSLDEAAPAPELLRIGNMIHFRLPPDEQEKEAVWVGPFRIVAVGSKISNDFSQESLDSGVMSVGIAYPQDASQQQKSDLTRLERFCDRQRNSEVTLLGVRIDDV